MNYYIDLFSPTTLEAFYKSDKTISGFSIRQESTAKQVEKGDIFLCYLTSLMRWVGALKVESESYFVDQTPRFLEVDDKYVVRFQVKPIVLLDLDNTVPIYEDKVWNSLSFTKDHEQGTSTWTGMIRNSLRPISNRDGDFLLSFLKNQAIEKQIFAFDHEKYQKQIKQQISHQEKIISVTVPEEEIEDNGDIYRKSEVRESIKIQAHIASIGEKMGYKIWIPMHDRIAVQQVWQPEDGSLLHSLPMDYGTTSMETIKQIDVLWLTNRYIVRAFEVEHTTSIYSGILRMADLMALQPNLDIKLHIVAPFSRKDKVFQEIQRPIFSIIENKPLYKICTYISYDSVEELYMERRLQHMNDSVIDDFVEEVY